MGGCGVTRRQADRPAAYDNGAGLEPADDLGVEVGKGLKEGAALRVELVDPAASYSSMRPRRSNARLRMQDVLIFALTSPGRLVRDFVAEVEVAVHWTPPSAMAVRQAEECATVIFSGAGPLVIDDPASVHQVDVDRVVTHELEEAVALYVVR